MTFITFFYLPGAVNKTDTIMPMNIQANINDSMCSLQQPNRNLATCNGNMECLFSNTAKGPKQVSQIGLWSPMTEGGEQVNQRT
jgi:hypothetical protein